ncbi:hypothetical protein B9Z55_026923 [Caenorhabditis nigoni]|uniref:F-box domain-containing protein n=1 Tax=Caenorhabditis nigoni TaxID=1611254 RepID=A0A2G5SIK1_9PELO|nr:hypothetical protein B9Z55_026923 [Caenorhabditis nigoni]
MEQPSAAVENNDHDLRTCILNDAVQKIPIFESYRNFCKTVGQDAMEYPVFEFWYYRFYHKQLDFDYDRSADPVPKTIMDLPVKLMYKIMENLDELERTYLRSMNKSMKDIADSRVPVFEKIDICVFEEFLEWYLDDKLFGGCYKEENGCTAYIPNKSEIKSEKSFMEKGMKYLTSLFRIPKIQVHHLELSSFKGSPTLNDDLLPVPFHAKSVKLHVFDMDQAFLFLSTMNPGELESINLEASSKLKRGQILIFFETEQFKQAKHVELEGYLNENDLLKFSHLKSFKCDLVALEPVDFQRVREIVSTFEKFESCELKRIDIDDKFQIRTISQALGEDVPFGPLLNTITHSYQIPESNEFLKFEIEDKEYYCIIKIVKIR